jgi:hypothetical protein
VSARRRHKTIPEAATAAVDKYVEFHRFGPRQIGKFPESFQIPTRMYRAGTSKWVTYESSKVDPETLVRPHRPISYIHEHDAGVTTYLTTAGGLDLDLERIEVPAAFRTPQALTRLGICLGFCFVDPAGNKREASGTRPLPVLYTVPSGKCLLVLDLHRERGRIHDVEVIAMMWGGGLGVFARGIDG